MATSDAVKVARVQRKAQTEKLLVDSGLELLKAGKELAVGVLANPGTGLILSFIACEYAERKRMFTGFQSTTIEAALLAGFALGAWRGD
jgi:uncharacterized membrane-anchored protein YjiN (DUF445 family)